jgi:hypothetical protein
MIQGDETLHMLHDFMHDGLKKILPQAIDQNDVRSMGPIIIKMMSNKQDETMSGHVEIHLNRKHDHERSNVVRLYYQKKYHDAVEIHPILLNQHQIS